MKECSIYQSDEEEGSIIYDLHSDTGGKKESFEPGRETMKRVEGSDHRSCLSLGPVFVTSLEVAAKAFLGRKLSDNN
ncbi:hypothetical protein TNIN_90341 [Trichonephila inaurata madagascariensis]|uniref:Uncharacterized protein n=1 Tax=Trichonephila inaurata madagascariensis TaxID=2747483 RepID=A0A8X7BXN4_9ARAC|nr:hypothetical protein TNIN_90341 [Trichonephila inaurata madagascariensis]